MIPNSLKIEEKTEVRNASTERFVIFVARGEHPVISFSEFARAEKLAIVLAGLTNTQMEVFDCQKEICYFVEPTEARVSIRHYEVKV